jgi:hypothetical protein
MLTKNYSKLSSEVQLHIQMDAVVQGMYWDDNYKKGCFIGCLTHSDNASVLEQQYGIPLPLVRVLEAVFEGLNAEDAKNFFSDIPKAIASDNKDLSLVHWKLIEQVVKAMPKVDDQDAQKAVDTVIDGISKLASGGEWSKEEARDAACTAYAAASCTAYDAAHYARYASATHSTRYATAAYSTDVGMVNTTQRDILLKLISEAPIK